MWVYAARSVCAIVLVAALGSACDADDSPRRAEPSGATPTPIATPIPSRPQSPFADLPVGAAPKVGYVDHYLHVAPDGTRTRLPRGRGISAIAPYLDAFLIADTRYFEGTSGLALVSDGKREDFGPCTGGGGAVSPDGASIAWATFACPESGIGGPTLIHRRTMHGEVVQQLTLEPNTNVLTSVVGILGPDIFYNHAFQDGTSVTDLVSAPRAIPGLAWTWSIDEVGLRIAGQAGRRGRIGVVVEPSTGRRVWGRLGVQPTTFSPRGISIVASSGRTWSVLDASSGVVRYELDVPDRVYLEAFAWEDEHHLLAVAGWSGHRKTAILRFDDQGNVELATPVTRSRGWDGGYVLDSQP